MTYRDPDSGLEFSSREEYERARGGFYDRPNASEDDLCAADGHPYAGDDGDVSRCYCGAQFYPKGGGEQTSL